MMLLNWQRPIKLDKINNFSSTDVTILKKEYIGRVRRNLKYI